MYTGKYKIAGYSVEINSLYQEVHTLCELYRTEEPGSFTVETNNRDIMNEQLKYKHECEYTKIPVQTYTDGHLETLAIYRKLCENLIEKQILLLHGSVVAIDGEAFLFTAKSGTGKSTHTRLWRELYGERAVMVNDDKPLLRITDQEILVYGTPWNGKHHIGSNICVPLKAICVLERDTENHIHRITQSEAYAVILQQSYKPRDVDKMEKTFWMLDHLLAGSDLYRMGCNISHEAAELAYRTMKG